MNESLHYLLDEQTLFHMLESLWMVPSFWTINIPKKKQLHLGLLGIREGWLVILLGSWRFPPLDSRKITGRPSCPEWVGSKTCQNLWWNSFWLGVCRIKITMIMIATSSPRIFEARRSRDTGAEEGPSGMLRTNNWGGGASDEREHRWLEKVA